MSYFKLLNIVFKNFPEIDFSTISDAEIIKIEKVLKLEIKLNKDLDINSLELFLHSLRDSPEVLSYFQKSTYLLTYFGVVLKTNSEKRISKTEDEWVLKNFNRKYLFHDIESFVNEQFVKEDFKKLEGLILFLNVLPTEILDLLDKKINNRLDYILHGITTKKFQYFIPDKSEFIQFAKQLDNQLINRKVEIITNQLLLITIKKTQEDRITAFFSFFLLFTDFFKYSLMRPKNKEEKNERRSALSGIYTVFGCLSIIAICLISFALYLKSDVKKTKKLREVERKEKFKKASLILWQTTFHPKMIVQSELFQLRMVKFYIQHCLGKTTLK